MILIGSGMYMAYMLYHTMLFERWIAMFRYKSNIGYLMYIADAFGYSASVAVMLYKDLGAHNLGWVDFYCWICYLTGLIVTAMSVVGLAILPQKGKPGRISAYWSAAVKPNNHSATAVPCLFK